MTAVLGEHAKAVAISSNKSMIGHTLSAAGAVEAIFTLLTLDRQRIPPTINYAVPDPTIPLDVVPNVARDAKVRHAISNSFGFGGQNVSLVMGREPAAMTAASEKRRALVTGGGRGLGAAIVRALAAAGHDVTFTYRSASAEADALLKTMQADHPAQAFAALAIDLADKAAVDAFAKDVERRAPFPPSCTMPGSPTTASP